MVSKDHAFQWNKKSHVILQNVSIAVFFRKKNLKNMMCESACDPKNFAQYLFRNYSLYISNTVSKEVRVNRTFLGTKNRTFFIQKNARFARVRFTVRNNFIIKNVSRNKYVRSMKKSLRTSRNFSFKRTVHKIL